MTKIAIHSPPRSGSTWLGTIFDSHPKTVYKYQPLFSYAFKDCLSFDSTQADVNKFFKAIAVEEDSFLDQSEAKKEGIIPSFPKANSSTIVYKEVRYHHLLSYLLAITSELKVIGLLRNPISTMYSWLNAPKEFEAAWNPLEEWRQAPKKNKGRPEEFYGYEKWKEVAWMFLYLKQAHPERFRLVTYEELNNAPSVVSKSLLSFCGLGWTPQTEKFIEESTKTPSDAPYGVYRQKPQSYAHTRKLHPEIKRAILADANFDALCTAYGWEPSKLE